VLELREREHDAAFAEERVHAPEAGFGLGELGLELRAKARARCQMAAGDV
jgi:hypothetical protein